MDSKKVFFAALMSASLSVFSPQGEARSAAEYPELSAAHAVEYGARSGLVFYQNSGMRLFIPSQHDKRLFTATPRKGGDGVLLRL